MKRGKGKQKSQERVAIKQAFPRTHHRASARGIAVTRALEDGWGAPRREAP